ncbi:helix-turn-helix transcriptional regulator [Nocardiopsis chromatogenes]|uniref:helix-turn-helix transcriptional regulator n=1 Tax=Nocardiopsis chromatogenes TaxID=280239 RepID=UPI000348EBFA|nr:helix-turn-helix transcriptional regulator [Nocardiopsis chromatogenes]
MAHSLSDLSRFLKSRRAAVDPAQAGVHPTVNRRRVSGLRREEVAQLAGVSVDYYTRIEQGRAGEVSEEVLDALAGALRLTGDERSYLFNLVRHAGPPFAKGADGHDELCIPPTVPRRRVRPELRELLDSMEGVPAAVLGTGLDLLAWNGPLSLIWPGVDDLPEPELNLARMVFLNPDTANLHGDAETVRRDIVAGLRAAVGRHPDEPRLCAVVVELRRGSARFRELWESHLVAERVHGTHTFRHPRAGELSLRYEKLPLPADPGQTLLLYSAAPGSPAEEGLRRLREEHAARLAHSG